MKSLTEIEEMVIAPLLAVMQVCYTKGHQLCYKEHIVKNATHSKSLREYVRGIQLICNHNTRNCKIPPMGLQTWSISFAMIDGHMHCPGMINRSCMMFLSLMGLHLTITQKKVENLVIFDFLLEGEIRIFAHEFYLPKPS